MKVTVKDIRKAKRELEAKKEDVRSSRRTTALRKSGRSGLFERKRSRKVVERKRALRSNRKNSFTVDTGIIESVSGEQFVLNKGDRLVIK